MTWKKRIMSFALITCMLIAILPTAAFAAEAEQEIVQPKSQEMLAGNSFAGATSISIGNTYFGSITSSNAADYYKFTITSSGRITLSATAQIPYVYYRLYDSAGNRLWSDGYGWNDTTEQSAVTKTLDLTKGTYYFVVERYYSDTGTYSFKLSFTSAGESFTETGNGTNNSMATASVVSLNQTYKGQIALNDEKDFYRFTVTTSGRITLEATAKIPYVYYRLYDSAGNRLWSDGYRWNNTTEQSAVTQTLDLTKGTYYFVVERYYSDTGNYSFRMSDGTKPVQKGFTDVPKSAYYYDAVQWAVKNNITSGTTPTTFSPNNPCTRAQVVTFLWNMNGKPEPKKTSNPFRDVKSTDWYYKAVIWAVQNKITSGTTATTFSPNAKCTRAQIVTFLWNMNGKPTVSRSNPFNDVKSTNWYYKAVMWAIQKGVTSGTTPTTFSPNQICTRAQVVTFLWNMKGKP